jgi:predicted deacetylase
MMHVPAQYLLRFDDLCPTLLRKRWERFVPLIEQFDIHPILAVVPENLDQELNLSRPDPAFWKQMRAMEAAGATIALHGYRHVCSSRGESFVPLHRHSEFAGVAEEIQRGWIHTGIEILRGHGLNPQLFVAPRHGFDHATLRALREEGIDLVSDGFGRVPFKRAGMIWIPQQLWAPREKSSGLWTICIHSNAAGNALVKELHDFLELHAAQFTSVERVKREWNPMQLSLMERVSGAMMLGRVRSSRFRKRWRRGMKKAGAN